MKRRDKDGKKTIKRRPMADTVLEALEPEAKQYAEVDSTDIGLYFVVKPTGAKSWALRYKNQAGKWTWMGIGPYGPGAHQLNGEQARTKARQMLAEAKSKGVPLELIRRPPADPAEAHKETFAELFEQWLAIKKKDWTPGTYDRAKRMLENHVLPTMGGRAYADIDAPAWLELLRGLDEKGIVETSTKTRTYCRSIYSLAQATGKAFYNPLDNLAEWTATSINQNFPRVTEEEIPALVRDIRAYPSRSIAIGLQLVMLLVPRPSELREAKWEEFDLDGAVWHVAAIRKKERRDFLLPLPRQAVTLLRELHHLSGNYPWLFPGRSKPEEKPLSDGTFNKALEILGYKGRQVAHGFRGLASTVLNNHSREHGFNHRIVDTILAHKVPGVEGKYNKSQYLTQRTELLQWWADYIDRVAGNV